MSKVYGVAKVNSKGGVVIPADLRKLKNIGEGDELAFVENENGEIIIKRGETSYSVKDL